MYTYGLPTLYAYTTIIVIITLQLTTFAVGRRIIHNSWETAALLFISRDIVVQTLCWLEDRIFKTIICDCFSKHCLLLKTLIHLIWLTTADNREYAYAEISFVSLFLSQKKFCSGLVFTRGQHHLWLLFQICTRLKYKYKYTFKMMSTCLPTIN